MLSKFFTAALALAIAAPAALSAAPADFGLKQGHAYQDLNIAVDLTRQRGGGTTTNPYIWLQATPAVNPLWPEVSVMATPETGVCSVSGSLPLTPLPESQIEAKVIEYIATHLRDLDTELGRHLYSSGDDLVASFDPDMVLNDMREMGFAIFVSVAEKRPDVVASEFFVSYDGEMFESAYRIIYQNGTRCDEIIESY